MGVVLTVRKWVLLLKTSIKRLPNGSRSEETVNNKTQIQGKSFLFFIFVEKWNLGRILFIFIHSLINSKSNELPQSLGYLCFYRKFINCVLKHC